MPYYKNTADDDQLFWLDNVDDEGFLPTTCVGITDVEAEAIKAAKEASNPPPPVTRISPRQIRMAMTQLGLRSVVEAAVAAGDQDLKDWYEFSTFFERNHPQVLATAAALNVDDTQLDALWALGATL